MLLLIGHLNAVPPAGLQTPSWAPYSSCALTWSPPSSSMQGSFQPTHYWQAVFSGLHEETCCPSLSSTASLFLQLSPPPPSHLQVIRTLPLPHACSWALCWLSKTIPSPLPHSLPSPQKLFWIKLLLLPLQPLSSLPPSSLGL